MSTGDFSPIGKMEKLIAMVGTPERISEIISGVTAKELYEGMDLSLSG